jgi:hypothetical protein
MLNLLRVMTRTNKHYNLKIHDNSMYNSQGTKMTLNNNFKGF